MKNSINPIGSQEFRKLLISYIPVQFFASILPLAGYWYSREIQSQNLAFLSIFGLLILQTLCAFYVRNFLNIKGRLKDIYPKLNDKELAHAPVLAFIPVISIPYFFFLCFADRSTRKAPLFFSYPGTTFCWLMVGSYFLSTTPFNFLSDPTSVYVHKEISRPIEVKAKDLSTFIAEGKKDVLFEDTMMKFVIVSSAMVKERERHPASVREISNISTALDYISYNTKIIQKMDNSKYYLQNSSPLYLLSPLYVLQTGLLMLMDEGSNAEFRKKNVSMFTGLINQAEKSIAKLDANERAHFEKRFIELKAEYQNTGTYKIVTAR